MPASPRITRERILEEAFALVREEGHDALRVRRLAARLSCSTQPVLYQFQTVEELRRAVYRRADEFHTAYIMALTGAYPDPMLEIGMRYIRFAHEEPALFRFLFQSGSFGGRSLEELIAEPAPGELIAMLSREAGLDPARAEELFRGVFTAVHGWASLLANNAMAFDPESAARTLVALGAGMLRELKERENDETV